MQLDLNKKITRNKQDTVTCEQCGSDRGGGVEPDWGVSAHVMYEPSAQSRIPQQQLTDTSAKAPFSSTFHFSRFRPWEPDVPMQVIAFT